MTEREKKGEEEKRDENKIKLIGPPMISALPQQYKPKPGGGAASCVWFQTF